MLAYLTDTFKTSSKFNFPTFCQVSGCRDLAFALGRRVEVGVRARVACCQSDHSSSSSPLRKGPPSQTRGRRDPNPKLESLPPPLAAAAAGERKWLCRFPPSTFFARGGREGKVNPTWINFGARKRDADFPIERKKASSQRIKSGPEKKVFF